MTSNETKKARGFGLALLLFASLATHASAQVERIVGGPQFILWSVEWWPEEPQEPHKHDGPTVIVYASDGVLKNAAGRQEAHHRGEVAYFPEGQTLNTGQLVSDQDDALTAVIFELRDTRPFTPKPSAEAPAFPRDGAIRVLENERVIVWDVTYPARQPTPFHRHEKPAMRVFLSEGRFRVETRSNAPPRTVTLRSMATLGVVPGTVDSEEALENAVRAIEIEVK
jgi:hypothetical protein